MFATLVDQGLIGYEDRVSDHWPEFAANGKKEVTVDSIFRHESGLARIRTDVVDWTSLLPAGIRRNELGRCVEKARLEFPRAESKTDRQYHAVSRGHIMNELFRRVDPGGRTIGEALRQDLSGPLRADVFVGLAPEEESRVRPLAAWALPYVVFQEALPEALGSKIERSTLGYIGGIVKAFKVRE